MIIFEDDEPKTLQQSEEDGGQVLSNSINPAALIFYTIPLEVR